ncbi:MAG: ATP-binding cassette domain-containing protein [Bacillus subtilis]|nr:ATP-binding cassette domain-containing protein [Bacillus subtilis]
MLIDINNLTFAYGHKVVLHDLSLTIKPGDFVVVSGKNGSGKSTLVKCLLGINAVSNGVIFYNHEDINYFKKWTDIGYVPQKFDDFNYEFPITVSGDPLGFQTAQDVRSAQVETARRHGHPREHERP